MSTHGVNWLCPAIDWSKMNWELALALGCTTNRVQQKRRELKHPTSERERTQLGQAKAVSLFQERSRMNEMQCGTGPESKLTQFGFQWGNCVVTRCCSFRGQWLAIRTPHSKANTLDIHITPSGRIRVYGPDGRKWKPQ